MDSALRYKDKVVLVTGAARGIGKGCLETFVRHGSKVAFCDIKEAEGKATEKEMNKKGPGEAYYIPCNLCDETQIKNMIDQVVEKYGNIDCLVNNAGFHPPHVTIDHFTSEDLNKLFQLNVVAYFLTCKYALPYIRLTKGNIINISSMVAQLGQKEAVTYSATKGAVTSMSKALAIDEARHGVRVNVISPGNIWTPLWQEVADTTENPEAFIQSALSWQVLGRMGTPSEVGMTCLYLAVDASFCTGIDISVSGGIDLSYGPKSEAKPPGK
ncbi:estradiol 17-beta-dehydrogenase 8-like [Argonauta hians]